MRKSVACIGAFGVLAACTPAASPVDGCGASRTLLDGVCVNERVADYVACVRAQGAQLGEEKGRKLSAEAGVAGTHAGVASEVRDTLERTYTVSDSNTLEIIRACNAASGMSSAAPTPPPASASAPLVSGPVATPGGHAQNEGSLGTPVPNCASGPLVVEFANRTDDQFVTLQIDGDDIAIRGRRGALPPQVPPQTSLYICLESLGQHVITGKRYVSRMDQLILAGTINVTMAFTANYNGNVGHHVVFINGLDVLR